MKLLKEENASIKAVVYGRSGTGKTTLGVTARKPLILLSELQGLSSIRAQADKMGIDSPDALHMESINDYKLIVRALKRGPVDGKLIIREAKDDKPEVSLPFPETVVIDSLTDVASMIEYELDRTAPMAISEKDGLPVKDLRRWGELMMQFRRFVYLFRELHVDVLFLCLLSDKTEGEGADAVRTVFPTTMTASTSEQMPSHVNCMGVAERTTDKDGVTSFHVLFHTPSHTLSKTMGALQAIEEPDFTNIVTKASKKITPTKPNKSRK